MKEARILRRHRTVDEARGKGVCVSREACGEVVRHPQGGQEK